MRKPSIKALRKKADSFCTPVAKKLHPQCELCGADTQVGHHYYKKSQSNALRYDPKNLVGLCHRCHCALHSREIVYTNRLRDIRGEEWHDYVRKILQTSVKTGRFFYENAIEYLQSLL